MSHTPGPWTLDSPEHVDENNEPLCDSNYHYIDAGGGYVDGETGHGFSLSGIMSPANARLIAAAPELLAKLQEIKEWADDRADINWNDRPPNDAMAVQSMIGDLISKATGGAQ